MSVLIFVLIYPVFVCIFLSIYSSIIYLSFIYPHFLSVSLFLPLSSVCMLHLLVLTSCGLIFRQIVNFECELFISLEMFICGNSLRSGLKLSTLERIYICFCQSSGRAPTQDTFKISTLEPWDWTNSVNFNCKPSLWLQILREIFLFFSWHTYGL